MSQNQLLLLALLLSSLALLASLVLLFYVIRLVRHYNSLTKGLVQPTLMAFLEGIQRTLSEHEKSVRTVRSELTKLQDNIRLHLQHLIVKRFNPFKDTGGDQSFILALLDGNRDGVVITSLHSRENTRFYVKSVKGGSGLEHPLSAEEQKLVEGRGK